MTGYGEEGGARALLEKLMAGRAGQETAPGEANGKSERNRPLNAGPSRMAQRRGGGFMFRRKPLSETEEIARRISLIEAITTILLIGTASVNALFTYIGVSVPLGEDGAGWQTKSMALLAALCVGIYGYLNWAYLFSFLRRISGWRWWAMLFTALLACITISAIDAPYNMMAFSGAAAQQKSLAEVAANAEDRLNAANSNLLAAMQALPLIRSYAAGLGAQEQAEIEGRGGTGVPGRGAASAAFAQGAAMLSKSAESIEEAFADSGRLMGQAKETLKELNAEVYRIGPIRARVERVAGLANELDDVLEQLRQQSPLIAIRHFAGGLGGVIVGGERAGGALGERQAGAIRKTEDAAGEMGDKLAGMIEEIEAELTPMPEKKRVLDVYEAIIRYKSELLSNWMIALLLGFAPWFYLIFLSLAACEIRHRQGENRSPDAGGEEVVGIDTAMQGRRAA